MTENNLIKNLQEQLDELETLQAMFYNPGEIKIGDIGVFYDIKDFVLGQTSTLPNSLDFTVNLIVDENKFELCVCLEHEYPFVEPKIFVRNHRLNKVQHVELNRKLGEFLADFPRGEPCIFSAISWLQDNSQNYVFVEKAATIPTQTKQDELVRFWIYSHHIYSKTKRKSLIDLADRLKLSGFILPGKPGIICVEGDADDVNEWWTTVRSMNWKRIFCKITETNKGDSDGNFLKFRDFVETVFENHGPKFNHMDMGEFHKYLEVHELGHIFKDLFGVDAKSG